MKRPSDGKNDGATSPQSGDTPLLLFDGVCNLCNGLVGFILEKEADGRMMFGAMQSPAGQQYLRRLGYPIDRYTTLLFLEDGKVFEKSDAVLRIVGSLRLPWRWFRFLGFLPVHLRDLVYDFVARHRYTIFGQRDSCRVPEAGERHRFLPMD